MCGMTIHLDITEDVQFLPLWREKFSAPPSPMKACRSGHILAAIQLLDCQRTSRITLKSRRFRPAQLSRAEESTGTPLPVNP